MTATNPITIETVVAFPPAEAWRAFTSPAAIVQWNQASPDWHCPAAEVGLCVGGRYCARMEARNGAMGFDVTGTYEEVDAPRALTPRLDNGRRARTTFVPEGTGSRVTTLFDAEAVNPADLQRAGWQAILDSYGRYVARAAGRG